MRIEKEQQRLWNPETIKLLVENGADLLVMHTITNVFVVFSQSELKVVETILEETGFTIEEIFEEIDDETHSLIWHIHATHRLLPNLENINKMTNDCIDLAMQNGFDYDGWFTQPESRVKSVE